MFETVLVIFYTTYEIHHSIAHTQTNRATAHTPTTNYDFVKTDNYYFI